MSVAGPAAAPPPPSAEVSSAPDWALPPVTLDEGRRYGTLRGQLCIRPRFLPAVMLFRFSALTWNAHRIHYQQDCMCLPPLFAFFIQPFSLSFARGEEGRLPGAACARAPARYRSTPLSSARPMTPPPCSVAAARPNSPGHGGQLRRCAAGLFQVQSAAPARLQHASAVLRKEGGR